MDEDLLPSGAEGPCWGPRKAPAGSHLVPLKEVISQASEHWNGFSLSRFKGKRKGIENEQ